MSLGLFQMNINQKKHEKEVTKIKPLQTDRKKK
jgi:hypothetical protein